MVTESDRTIRANPEAVSISGICPGWHLNCRAARVENRTEPKTVRQWIRYVVVALIALFLVWWMLRLYVF